MILSDGQKEVLAHAGHQLVIGGPGSGKTTIIETFLKELDPDVVVAQINRNGVDDTSNWTITWTTTNLTPASGTGATVTLTLPLAAIAIEEDGDDDQE